MGCHDLGRGLGSTAADQPNETTIRLRAGAVLSGVNAAPGQTVLALTSGVPSNAAASGVLAFDPSSGKLYGYGAAGWAVVPK